MVTEAKGTELKSGLRILAHMIARAYLKDMSRKQSEPTDSQDKEKEESNGDKRRV